MTTQHKSSDATIRRILRKKSLKTLEEMNAIRLLDDPCVPSLLIKSLSAKNTAIRDAASIAIRQRGEEGFQALLSALKRRSSLREKNEVVRLLGIWNDRRATAPLMEALEAIDERKKSVWYFMLFSGLLLVVLTPIFLVNRVFTGDKNTAQLISGIVETIALLRDPKSLKTLILRRKRHRNLSNNWTVREAIIDLMQKRSEQETVKPEVLEREEYLAILSLLKEDDQMSWEAMQLLKFVGRKDALPLLAKIQKRNVEIGMRRKAAETIESILLLEAERVEKSTLLRSCSLNDTAKSDLLRPAQSQTISDQELAELLLPANAPDNYSAIVTIKES